jgi:hypothetical protein
MRRFLSLLRWTLVFALLFLPESSRTSCRKTKSGFADLRPFGPRVDSQSSASSLRSEPISVSENASANIRETRYCPPG